MTHDEKRARRTQIADAVRLGGNPGEIAFKFKVSLSTVHSSCTEFGVPLPNTSRGPAGTFNPFALLIDLLAGMTFAACGEKYGVSKARVGQIAMEASTGGWQELKNLARDHQRASGRKLARRTNSKPGATHLAKKRCVSCAVGAKALTPKEVQGLLPSVPDWNTSSDGKRIRREWRVRDFLEALGFFQRVAEIAEVEDHHPDLHLVGYRNVTIESWTHAVGGLTENDFILAAKIDRVPVAVKT